MAGELQKQRHFTIKDIVYIVCIALSVYGTHTATQTHIVLLEERVSSTSKRILVLEAQVDKYKDLPKAVADLTKSTDEITKTLGIVRDGLIASGIIKPSTN